MYVSTRTGHTMQLFGPADHLTGPWHEHPSSPIRSHRHKRGTRAAGRVRWLRSDERDPQSPLALHRFAQDNAREYGGALLAFRVEVLTAYRYRETEVATAWNEARAGWNRDRYAQHHFALCTHAPALAARPARF
jgi:hypothetical protein